MNRIVEAVIDSGSILLIEFAYPVTPAQIVAMTMVTSPNNRTKVSSAQNTATNLAVTFSSTILLETSLTTSTPPAGFMAQTAIPIT